ncbi:F0F1 ATP synthase subunit epsilon [Lactobacillus sp. S2-2]|uniref:F0F1 ATP synthase subunit epsilon n=1 Tax=Lactobacillus sp. S2-2 TaxID=2692917 RepID=UPI001F0087C6|nr:F0F1 ATP synthase subunit epsilon [Lactobacillus sp. S2-2]MCF6515771.1 F0F1 ATP synthase subunit epsilon [Lactobacillus sp. S2-2]
MADNKSLTVSIVTPDGEAYNSDQTNLVIVQTLEGDIGIMHDHVPLIASLKIGEAIVKFDDDKKDEITVNGGFAEFSNNILTIVADSAENKGDIDINRADSARERAEKKIQLAKENNDTDTLKRAQVSLRRALNRINVSKH